MKRHTLFLSIALAGCDSGNSDTIDFTMRSSLAAGQEQHLCQFVQLPESATGEIMVTGSSHRAVGAHHWSVIRTTVTSLPQGFELDEPVDCFSSGISAYAGTALFIQQEGSPGPSFPEGTALPFAAGELLMLQLHAVNPTASALDLELDVSLETAGETPIANRVGLIQFYDPFIYVPPMGSSEAHLRCAIPEQITLLNATTHFHLRGTDEKVFVDLPGQPASAPLVESTDWEHPNAWNGSMTLPAGSSVHFNCSYQNSEDRPYIQGQDKGENEMCMVIGFYYPQLDDMFEGCFTGTEVGTGAAGCAETSQCLQACPPSDDPTPNGSLAIDVGPCFQKCMVESCASAGAPLFQLNGCLEQNCAAACSAGGPDCGACVASQCGGEFGACQTHTCS